MTSKLILNEKYIVDKINIDDYKSFINVHMQLENTIKFTENKFIELINEIVNTKGIYVCIRMKSNNEIIGCGKFFIDIKFGKNKGFIDDVVIDKNHRDRKLGTYLINYLLEYASKQNCYVCNIICKEENKNFYIKQGFKNDRILMRYIIND